MAINFDAKITQIDARAATNKLINSIKLQLTNSLSTSLSSSFNKFANQSHSLEITPIFNKKKIEAPVKLLVGNSAFRDLQKQLNSRGFDKMPYVSVRLKLARGAVTDLQKQIREIQLGTAAPKPARVQPVPAINDKVTSPSAIKSQAAAINKLAKQQQQIIGQIANTTQPPTARQPVAATQVPTQFVGGTQGPAGGLGAVLPKTGSLAQLKAMREDFTGLHKITADWVKQLNIAAKRLTAWSTIAYGMFAVQDAIASTWRTTIEFESAIMDSAKVMGETRGEVRMLGEEMRGLAQKYAIGLVETAKAADIFAQQGMSMGEVIKMTNASLLLHRVSTLSTVESTEALTSIMRQFNLDASESIRIVDSLNEAANKHAVTQKDLAEAFNRSGAAAKVAGINEKQLMGIVTAIQAPTRLGGSTIGTAIKTISTRLFTEKAEDALTKVNVSIRDQNGELRNGYDVLKDLAAVWPRLTQEQKVNTATNIAGRWHYSIFANLLGNFQEAIQTTVDVEKSAGSATKEMAFVMESNANRIAKAFTKMSSIGTEALQPLVSLFTNLLELMVSWQGVAVASGAGALFAGYKMAPGFAAEGGFAGKNARSVLSGYGNEIGLFSQVFTAGGRQRVGSALGGMGWSKRDIAEAIYTDRATGKPLSGDQAFSNLLTQFDMVGQGKLTQADVASLTRSMKVMTQLQTVFHKAIISLGMFAAGVTILPMITDALRGIAITDWQREAEALTSKIRDQAKSGVIGATGQYGIIQQMQQNASQGQTYTLAGLAAGAQLGSVAGPYGVVGGALLGGIVGRVLGMKDAEKKEQQAIIDATNATINEVTKFNSVTRSYFQKVADAIADGVVSSQDIDTINEVRNSMLQQLRDKGFSAGLFSGPVSQAIKAAARGDIKGFQEAQKNFQVAMNDRLLQEISSLPMGEDKANRFTSAYVDRLFIKTQGSQSIADIVAEGERAKERVRQQLFRQSDVNQAREAAKKQWDSEKHFYTSAEIESGKAANDVILGKAAFGVSPKVTAELAAYDRMVKEATKGINSQYKEVSEAINTSIELALRQADPLYAISAQAVDEIRKFGEAGAKIPNVTWTDTAASDTSRLVYSLDQQFVGVYAVAQTLADGSKRIRKTINRGGIESIAEWTVTAKEFAEKFKEVKYADPVFIERQRFQKYVAATAANLKALAAINDAFAMFDMISFGDARTQASSFWQTVDRSNLTAQFDSLKASQEEYLRYTSYLGKSEEELRKVGVGSKEELTTRITQSQGNAIKSFSQLQTLSKQMASQFMQSYESLLGVYNNVNELNANAATYVENLRSLFSGDPSKGVARRIVAAQISERMPKDIQAYVEKAAEAVNVRMEILDNQLDNALLQWTTAGDMEPEYRPEIASKIKDILLSRFNAFGPQVADIEAIRQRAISAAGGNKQAVEQAQITASNQLLDYDKKRLDVAKQILQQDIERFRVLKEYENSLKSIVDRFLGMSPDEQGKYSKDFADITKAFETLQRYGDPTSVNRAMVYGPNRGQLYADRSLVQQRQGAIDRFGSAIGQYGEEDLRNFLKSKGYSDDMINNAMSLARTESSAIKKSEAMQSVSAEYGKAKVTADAQKPQVINDFQRISQIKNDIDTRLTELANKNAAIATVIADNLKVAGSLAESNAKEAQDIVTRTQDVANAMLEAAEVVRKMEVSGEVKTKVEMPPKIFADEQVEAFATRLMSVMQKMVSPQQDQKWPEFGL